MYNFYSLVKLAKNQLSNLPTNALIKFLKKNQLIEELIF